MFFWSLDDMFGLFRSGASVYLLYRHLPNFLPSLCANGVFFFLDPMGSFMGFNWIASRSLPLLLHFSPSFSCVFFVLCHCEESMGPIPLHGCFVFFSGRAFFTCGSVLSYPLFELSLKFRATSSSQQYRLLFSVPRSGTQIPPPYSPETVLIFSFPLWSD